MRLYVRSADRLPDPAPIVTDDRKIVLGGTGAWAVLLVVAVLARGTLAAHGRGWWVWTPVAGIALGLYGVYYLHRRRAAGERLTRTRS